MTLKFRKLYDKHTPYNLIQYKLDNALIYKYGLRNKSEVRKVEAKVKKYRVVAKRYSMDTKTYNDVCTKLAKKGIIPSTISIDNAQHTFSGVTSNIYNLLNLTVEHFLDRRIQTVVALKFNISPLLSRQLITTKRIKCNQIICIRPCHIVDSDASIECL